MEYRFLNFVSPGTATIKLSGVLVIALPPVSGIFKIYLTYDEVTQMIEVKHRRKLAIKIIRLSLNIGHHLSNGGYGSTKNDIWYSFSIR